MVIHLVNHDLYNIFREDAARDLGVSLILCAIWSILTILFGNAAGSLLTTIILSLTGISLTGI